MLRLTISFLFFFCLIAFSHAAGQQRKVPVDSRLQKARLQVIRGNFDKAERQFKMAIKKQPYQPEAYRELGLLYSRQRQYGKAADLFQQAAGSCPECASAFAFPLAELLWKAQRFTEAEKVLSTWRKPELPEKRKWELELLHQHIHFARSAMSRPPGPEPENLGLRVNSPYDEYFPSISLDDSLLIFTRRTSHIDEDFYLSRRDSCGGWFSALDMGEPPNSAQNEGAQAMSADGHYLFFMRCGNRSLNGRTGGGCDLYFAFTDGTSWSFPEPFGATINTPAYEGMPSLAPDNRTLYFVSDREGGYGGMDIWCSRFEYGRWQVPVNLGPEVNTPGDETAPWIAFDNRSLYFTSTGHPGLGGKDIFISRKDQDDRWSVPQNLGYPLNTPYDDQSFCPAADGRYGYFASNRPGGYGLMDLYRVALRPEQQPEPLTFVYGKLYDSLSGMPVTKADIELWDAQEDRRVNTYESNPGNGSFLLAVPLADTVLLKASHYRYWLETRSLYISEQHFSRPDTIRIPMLPKSYRPPLKEISLVILTFEPDSLQLTDSLKVAIQERIAPYLHDRFTEFFIHGHTGPSGPAETRALVAAERARSVETFLKELGVDPDKLVTQSWSDSQPLVPDELPEKQLRNNRVEIILRTPE